MEASTLGGTGWSQTYNYDQYGNQWVDPGLVLSSFTPTSQSNYIASNNRMNLVEYDAAGNMTTRGSNALTWDAEGRRVKDVQTVSGNTYPTLYVYDGEGRRVKKQTYDGRKTIFVYDAASRLVAEYSDVAGSDCATCYLFGDHLGSTRMVADAGGAVRKRFDYMPFGVEIKLGSGFASSNGRSAEHESGTPVTLQFTGAYRDGAPGEVPVDFMGARSLQRGQGRWTSPNTLHLTTFL